MFSHIMIGTNDLDKAKTFYDALLGALGVPEGRVDRHRIFWRTKTGTFSVTKPINGEAATFANGGTIGFLANSTGRSRRVPRRRSRPWRQDLRGAAGHPRRHRREIVHRVFARSRRQQALRVAPRAVTAQAPSWPLPRRPASPTQFRDQAIVSMALPSEETSRSRRLRRSTITRSSARPRRCRW